MTHASLGAYKHALKIVLPAAVAAVVLALPLASPRAATPGSGTVSASNPAVTWTGAFTLATAGGCTGPDDSTCDHFSLTINPPAGQFQVKIVLAPSGDWDLDVFGPNGGLAGSSGNGPGQPEIVTLTNPSAGTYDVAGAPFAPLVGADATSYHASATLTSLGDSPPGADGTEPLSFGVHPAPASIGADAGEPSLGADWTTGRTMFQAGLTAARVTFDDSVSPPNATWTDVSWPTSSLVSLDPIGFMDNTATGARWFSSQLSGTTSLAAFTDDDGANWLPSEGGPLNGGVDHQTFGGGPYHAPLTGTIYPHAIYYCSQDLVAALCARSDTGGASFAPAVPIYTDQCGGLHGHVKVGPDGTVYVPNKACGGRQGVVVSEDNGLNWTVRTVPGSTNGAWDPSVGIGADGTVYLGYDDGDGHAKVAVSHDRGQTWVNVHDLGVNLGVVQSAFPVATAGDADRAAIGFLGTSYAGSGAFGDDPNWPGVWYLYVATTYDGGATWTTVNAAPDDPVQRGTICGGGFNGCANGTRNLLDFMDASVDEQGRVLIGFADGCLDSCVASGPNTFSALATIARQVNGRGLFAAHDPHGVPAAPNLSGKAIGGTPPSNLLTWQAPNDGGSAITGYQVYRRAGAGSYAALGTLGAGTTSYSDTQLVAGETYTYKVSAVNANGEGAASNEVSPIPPPPPEDPCVAPGVRILSDGTGDEVDQNAAHDFQWASIAEPRSIGAAKIEFLFKVASLSSVPASTTWPVVFKAGGVDRFVRMQTDALSAVTFSYGTGSTGAEAGSTADASSGYSADGTIRVIVSRSELGVGAGDRLTDFIVRVRVEAGPAGAVTPDNSPDSLARTGSYTVRGNENCSVPQPDLAVSATDLAFTGLHGQGNDQVIAAVVHNAGTLTALNVPVRFTVDGAQVGAVQRIASIAPGATSRVSVVWDTHGNGMHSAVATADPTNAIAESNESNNAGSRLVTVHGGRVVG
jgi:hypothetical protein